MGYREVTSQADLIKWDMPKMLEGAYLGGEERDGEFGPNMVHTIELADGKVAFYGTAMLNEALGGVKPGTLVKVEYTGEQRKTKKGFRVKLFHVSVWDSEGAPEAPDDGPDDADKAPF